MDWKEEQIQTKKSSKRQREEEWISLLTYCLIDKDFKKQESPF